MNEQLPATFAQQLQEKLQTTIGDMIPPDAYKAMVDANIKLYMEKTLPAQVEAELRKHFAGLIQAELAKPEWQERYLGYGAAGAGEMVTKIMTENADVVFARMMSGMAQGIVDHLRSGLRQF